MHTETIFNAFVQQVKDQGLNVLFTPVNKYGPELANSLRASINRPATHSLVWIFSKAVGREIASYYELNPNTEHEFQFMGHAAIQSDALPPECYGCLILVCVVDDKIYSYMAARVAWDNRPSRIMDRTALGTKSLGLPSEVFIPHTLRSAAFTINESTGDPLAVKPVCSDEELIRLREYSILIDDLRDAYDKGVFSQINLKTMAQLARLLFVDDSPTGPKHWPRNFLSPSKANESPTNVPPIDLA